MFQTPFTCLTHDLIKRSEEKGPIRVGIIGIGEMGTDLITQFSLMKGMVVSAVSTRNVANARQAVRIAYGDEEKLYEATKESSLTEGIERNKINITSKELLVKNPLIDVVIDATGKPTVAADFCLLAMEHGKHIVTMNAEADVTIGILLKHYADRLGVIYTLGAGDEPSSCMELVNFVNVLGYKIVCAGKGKNNRLDYDVLPEDCWEEAQKRNMNPKMLVEFIDGSKTMVEMAILANATGLVPDVAGMHGPSVARKDLEKVFIPKENGGILSQRGVVDYTIGSDISPGVFVVFEVTHPRIIERMNDLGIGKGPFYTFFRPYHLTSLEVPLTVARVMLYGQADMVPLSKPVAEVCALAKRDLFIGEKLDSIGEVSYRAWTMNIADARKLEALPVGMLEGAKVKKTIKKGHLITYDTVELDTTTRLYSLRAMQDKMLYHS